MGYNPISGNTGIILKKKLKTFPFLTFIPLPLPSVKK